MNVNSRTRDPVPARRQPARDRALEARSQPQDTAECAAHSKRDRLDGAGVSLPHLDTCPQLLRGCLGQAPCLSGSCPWAAAAWCSFTPLSQSCQTGWVRIRGPKDEIPWRLHHRGHPEQQAEGPEGNPESCSRRDWWRTTSGPFCSHVTE